MTEYAKKKSPPTFDVAEINIISKLFRRYLRQFKKSH